MLFGRVAVGDPSVESWRLLRKSAVAAGIGRIGAASSAVNRWSVRNSVVGRLGDASSACSWAERTSRLKESAGRPNRRSILEVLAGAHMHSCGHLRWRRALQSMLHSDVLRCVAVLRHTLPADSGSSARGRPLAALSRRSICLAQIWQLLPMPFLFSPLTTHGLRLTCTTTHGTSVTRPQSDRRPARSSSHDSSQRGGCARLTRPRPGWRLTRRPPQGRGRARAHARQRTHAGEALPPPPPAPAPELSATTRTRSETAPARR